VTRRLGAEEVAHVAGLARLDLSVAELEEFTGQLADVLAHAEDIAALDLHDVTPTAHPHPLVNVVRADVVRPGVDRDEVLAAAPATEDHRFRVPRVLGDAP